MLVPPSESATTVGSTMTIEEASLKSSALVLASTYVQAPALSATLPDVRKQTVPDPKNPATRTIRHDFLHCALLAEGLCGHPLEWSVNPLDFRWADPFDPKRSGLCRDCWHRRKTLLCRGGMDFAVLDPGDEESPRFQRMKAEAKSRQGGLRDFRGTVLRVLCYGDSFSAGYCTMAKRPVPGEGVRGEGYAPALQERLGALLNCTVDVDMQGVNGLTLEQICRSVDREVFGDTLNRQAIGLRPLLRQRGPYHFAVIGGGVQDQVDGVTAQRSAECLKFLGNVCLAHQTPVVLLGMPDGACASFGAERFAARVEQVDGELRRWRELQEERIQNSLIIKTSALLPYEGPESVMWEKDGTHLTEEGSTELGHRIAHVLEPWLKDGNEVNSR